MVLFQGKPYELDMLYMKLTGDPEIVSVPFCEMFDAATNVKYDHARTKLLTESTGVYTVCFVADMGKITKKPFEVPADELAKTYATVLYNNKRQIPTKTRNNIKT